MTDRPLIDYRQRLVAARERLGLSRKAMARQLLTPWQTYSQWETGSRRTPGVAVVAAEGVSQQRKSSRGRRGPPLSAELDRVIAQAVRDGLTITELAAKIGRDKTSVRAAARRRGVQLAKRRYDWPAELRLAMERGESGSEVARRLGCAPNSVYSAARARGIALRDARLRPELPDTKARSRDNG